MMQFFGFVFLFSAIFGVNDGANILGLFPHPGKSHFDVFQVYMEGLAQRGHNVTVMSFFPHKNPPPGYKDISLEGLHPIFLNIVNFDEMDSSSLLWPLTVFYQVMDMGLDSCKAILPSPQIQNLFNSDVKYDLAVVEQFSTDCFLSIFHKLQIPYIGITSCAPLPWHQTRFGIPTNPASTPNILAGLTDRMSYLERFENGVVQAIVAALYYPLFDRPAHELATRYIGETPPLSELAKNTSLMLLNTHFTFHNALPTVPGYIEIGGIHVKPAQPLPKDLEEFVKSGKDGVIIFSLGSMLNAETLPAPVVQIFINVFKKLPQLVIWKLSGKVNYEVPPNVKILSWLPQRDILAHPNVRAFIAHGGLLGVTEAIFEGKPMVAIPIFGDQHLNVRTAVQHGIAVELPYSKISEETVETAIKTVLSKKYQEKAAAFSKTFLDRPMHPMQTAIYWTEYVIRNGGTPLRIAAVDLSYIQYYYLDVLIPVFLAIATLICAISKFLTCVIKLCKNKKTKRD